MKTKQAVSLIVLVITIIVMVILAGAIILTLNNTGIINKASEAVKTTNEATMKEVAQLAWAEAYADGTREQAELETAVMTKLNELNFDLTSYKIEVTEKGVTITEKENLNHTGTIPEGATYYWHGYVYGDETTVTYAAGETFPALDEVDFSVTTCISYVYKDYSYTYDSSSNGWGVTVNNKNQTSYSEILESINGAPIVNMGMTFSGCTTLTMAPAIPDSVTILARTFENCTALTTAPEIPKGVTNMYMTFSHCTSLDGTIIINTNNINNTDLDVDNTCLWCFANVDMTNIKLTGDASKDILNLIGGTGENWTNIE